MVTRIKRQIKSVIDAGFKYVSMRVDDILYELKSTINGVKYIFLASINPRYRTATIGVYAAESSYWFRGHLKTDLGMAPPTIGKLGEALAGLDRQSIITGLESLIPDSMVRVNACVGWDKPVDDIWVEFRRPNAADVYRTVRKYIKTGGRI